MCDYWNIDYLVYMDRMRAGWSKEKALITPARKFNPKFEENTHASKYQPCKDHLGNTYISMREMCKHYGIKVNTYRVRLKYGMSVKDALTSKDNIRKEKYIDHTGNAFPSKKAMCEAWNITLAQYNGRRKMGWPLEKILTTPCHKHNAKMCFDYKGQAFDSIREMCEAYGITCGKFNFRIKNGWSIEDALTKPCQREQKCTDHEGTVFSSITEMCNHWYISPVKYRSRINKGWSIEEALTNSKVRGICTLSVDHLGNKFPSMTAMCDYWGTNLYTFKYRTQNKGWSVADALTKNVFIPKRKVGKYIIVKPLEHPYFLVKDSDGECICTYDELITEHRKLLKEKESA